MDDATYLALASQPATPAVCSVPGCGALATIRRVSAEPSHWELGELDPLVVVAFFCDEHAGGVDAPENA